MKDYTKAKEEIKSRISIIDVIGPVVSLKRTGANYKGCCPFHKEKTPSFIVNEERNKYHCFGCGEDGDAIKFVEKYYNLSFIEAVEKLCLSNGITIEETSGESEGKKEAYYEANKMAAQYFFNAIKSSANKGYTYVSKRGMDVKTIAHFGIGWADESWDGLVKYMNSKGVDNKMLVELGLASESKGKVYDKYRSRVIFPIINVRGKVIGFGGRIVGDGEPKYLNSPESIIFQKKLNLFGLNTTKSDIRESGYAILVEGYMDMVSLYQYGVKNVVASLGTALTDEQAKLLARHTKKVILCYDADNAGINAALRGIDVLRKAGIETRVLHVDDGKDPDEYVKKHGKDAFIKLVETKSLPDVDYKFNLIEKKYDFTDTTQGIKFLKEIASVLKTLDPIEQDTYLRIAAQKYHVSENALRKEVEGSLGAPIVLKTELKNNEPAVVKADKSSLNLERMVIRLIMLHSDYFKKIKEYPDCFVSEEGKRLRYAFESKYIEGSEFEIDDLKDILEDTEYIYLQKIIDKIEAPEDDVSAFNDCIAKLEYKKTQERIKEINLILQMADSLPEEDVNQEEIAQLLKEIKQLQSK